MKAIWNKTVIAETPFLENAARLDAALVTHGYAVLNPQGFATASA